MSGNKPESPCDPATVVHGQRHKHGLLCDHHAYYDDKRRKVFYIQGNELQENCDNGHTHRSKPCLKHEFTAVAQPGEDCSKRDDCHLHVRDDGVAELHHPAEEKAKIKKCQVVREFKPLS